MNRALASMVSSLLLFSAGASAQSSCAAPEHRQFDFWLGEWEVYGAPGTPADGKLQGTNRIESSSSGCSLTETWRSARGVEGRSLNVYDAVAKQWRQFWVGGDGGVLQLAGHFRDGRMVLSGELPKQEGGMQQQRITWTPNEDRSVAQQWDTSDDGGATWNTIFLGIYRRPDAQ
jgi:hypothetical protein